MPARTPLPRIDATCPYGDAPQAERRKSARTAITEQQAGRAALNRLATAKPTDIAETAEACFAIAETILTAQPGTADKDSLTALNLIVTTVAVDPKLMQRAMTTCVRTILANPGRRVTRRSRFSIQSLLDAHGKMAYAAFKITMLHFTDAGGGHGKGVQQSLTDWGTTADARLAQLPLSDSQWLHRLAVTGKDALTDDADPTNGTAHWKLGSGPYRDATETASISWNANSFLNGSATATSRNCWRTTRTSTRSI